MCPPWHYKQDWKSADEQPKKKPDEDREEKRIRSGDYTEKRSLNEHLTARKRSLRGKDTKRHILKKERLERPRIKPLRKNKIYKKRKEIAHKRKKTNGLDDHRESRKL